jgi:uncharacterized protein (DUF4415 family)
MNMKRIKKDVEAGTSARARAHGLRRILRRHITQPGEVKLSDCKVRVTMYLDADVLEYFKDRAARPHAAPYQTQINAELRRIMEGKASMTIRDALNTIAAAVERVEAEA